jgi:hypothetical protein
MISEPPFKARLLEDSEANGVDRYVFETSEDLHGTLGSQSPKAPLYGGPPRRIETTEKYSGIHLALSAFPGDLATQPNKYAVQR